MATSSLEMNSTMTGGSFNVAMTAGPNATGSPTLTVNFTFTSSKFTITTIEVYKNNSNLPTWIYLDGTLEYSLNGSSQTEVVKYCSALGTSNSVARSIGFNPATTTLYDTLNKTYDQSGKIYLRQRGCTYDGHIQITPDHYGHESYTGSEDKHYAGFVQKVGATAYYFRTGMESEGYSVSPIISSGSIYVWANGKQNLGTPYIQNGSEQKLGTANIYSSEQKNGKA